MSKRSLRSRTRRSVEWTPSSESLAEQNMTAVRELVTAKEAVAPKKLVTHRQPIERGRGRGRGRDRGRGRTPDRVATLELNPRPKTPTARKAKSVQMTVDRQLSHQGSSSGVHPKNQGFVTKKAFNDKLGKIEKALQTLLNRQGSEKFSSEEQKSTETVSPPQAVMGVVLGLHRL